MFIPDCKNMILKLFVSLNSFEKVKIFMKSLFLICIGFSLIAICCNYKNPEPKHNSRFAGNWLSKNYIDSLNKYGTPAKVSIRCEELIVNFSGDSACSVYNNNQFTAYKIMDVTDSSFRIKKFNKDDYTQFTITASGKSLKFDDKTSNVHYVLNKAEPKYAVTMINGWASALELFFNEYIIAARYNLINVENKKGLQVNFDSYGKITGLPGYTQYSICLGGNCSSLAEEDLITLGNGSASENFIWEWKKDTLTFNSVNNISAISDKPHYAKGMPIFRFVKIL
jgi:hypothetical protein